MIEVEQLTRYYNDFPALRNISTRIESGEIVGFLGLNGAGKTTMLRVLAGLLPPSAGKVTIDGVDLEDAPNSFRHKIGFLPDEPPLYREMRVRDYLVWCGQIKGCSVSQARHNVQSVLRTCGIDDVADAVIDELSFGYRKRVGIAQAIIHRPRLVILDEPIAGLDPVQIVEMREVVRNLKQESTVLVSSHILSEITQTCDRILVLHRGELVATGSEHDLAQQAGGTTALELSLRGSPAAARRVLAELPFVTEVDIVTTDDCLHVTVSLLEDERERLVAALVTADIGVRRVERARSELETVFLELTQAAATTDADPRRGAA
ncbi:MAG: ABC transporter ATP-binding protein [Myxococcales bacterium FL481]|nr:MAG: ABC transporter ATP-binding protein [Myxococcales bacterium FL481]